MNGSNQLLKLIVIVALIIGAVYWYRNRNVTDYKVTVKETVKEDVR